MTKAALITLSLKAKKNPHKYSDYGKVASEYCSKSAMHSISQELEDIITRNGTKGLLPSHTPRASLSPEALQNVLYIVSFGKQE